MLPVLPVFTLLLATAADRPRARRRRKLRPPDTRWLDLRSHARDLALAGVEEDLLAWIVGTAERPGLPPLLDDDSSKKMRKTLSSVEGAKLDVNDDGRWSVHQNNWLVRAEPWSSERLIGGPDPIPGYTGQRVELYRAEAARHRSSPPHHGVPGDAELLLTEMWLPAAPLHPNPTGLDYDVVQLTVWRLTG